MEKLNLKPISVQSKLSYIHKNTEIGSGMIAMAKSYINRDTKIGDYCIINMHTHPNCGYYPVKKEEQEQGERVIDDPEFELPDFSFTKIKSMCSLPLTFGDS